MRVNVWDFGARPLCTSIPSGQEWVGSPYARIRNLPGGLTAEGDNIIREIRGV